MDATSQKLLTDIEACLELFGISQTRFGYVVMGDPAFVGRLRNGREIRPTTRARVEAGLQDIYAKGKL